MPKFVHDFLEAYRAERQKPVATTRRGWALVWLFRVLMWPTIFVAGFLFGHFIGAALN